MKKRTTKQDKIDNARIQRAIVGLQIPMTQITAVYNHAETLIARGANDAELADGIRLYVKGITK
jgi:hypothetical protein